MSHLLFFCLAFNGSLKLEIVKNVVSKNMNEDFYLNQPVDMAIQGDFLYITDHHEHCILKLSLAGKYLERIGRQGEGPGEFFRPISVFSDHEDLFVYDNTRRFQTLSSDGIYKNSFKTVEFIDEFIIKKDRIYAIRINRVSGGFFSCLTLEGKEVFRKKLDFTSRYENYFQDNYSKIHLIDDQIVILQIYDPTLHIYSEKGEKVREIKFEFSPFSDKVFQETNYKSAFQDVVAIGNKWLTFYPFMGGLKWCLFGDEGKLLERGLLEMDPEAMGNLRAAEARETENGYRLYLLLLEPERNLLIVDTTFSSSH